MAFPFIPAMIAGGAGLANLFGGSSGDPFAQTTRTFLDTGRLFREQLARNFGQLQGLSQPILSDLMRSAAVSGQRTGQDIQASLGALGGGGTGVGAISRSIAASLAANQVAQTRASFLSQLLGMAMGPAQQQLGGALGQIGPKGPNAFERFFQGLSSGALATQAFK